MALRNIIAPVAALLLASAVGFSPALAARANNAVARANAPSSGGKPSNASSPSKSSTVRSGRHASAGRRYAGHRSRGRSYYRTYRYRPHYDGGVFVFPWGLFGAYGAPYPYYAGPTHIVCRTRWVRRHGRLVRRRYCWHDYW